MNVSKTKIVDQDFGNSIDRFPTVGGARIMRENEMVKETGGREEGGAGSIAVYLRTRIRLLLVRSATPSKCTFACGSGESGIT